MSVLAGSVALGDAGLDRDIELRLKNAVGSSQSLLTTVGVDGALFVLAASAARGPPYGSSVVRRGGGRGGAVVLPGRSGGGGSAVGRRGRGGGGGRAVRAQRPPRQPRGARRGA